MKFKRSTASLLIVAASNFLGFAFSAPALAMTGTTPPVPASKAAPLLASPPPSGRDVGMPMPNSPTQSDLLASARHVPAPHTSYNLRGQPPIVLWLLAAGNTLVPLGKSSGLQTWLIQTPLGDSQVGYVTPDGWHIIIGTMLNDQGKDQAYLIQLEAMKISQPPRVPPSAISASVKSRGEIAKAIALAYSHRQPYSPRTPKLGNDPIFGWLSQNTKKIDLFKHSIPGVPGLLFLAKNGKKYVGYIAPGGKSLIDGILVGAGGVDVTAMQIQGPTTSVTVLPRPTGNVGNAAVAATVGAPPIAQQRPIITDASASPPPARPATAPEKATATPYLGDQDSAQVITINETAFESELSKAAFFTVGKASAPSVVMLADPTCPVCHSAWSLMEPLIKSGQISADIVLAHIRPHSKQATIDALSNPNVGTAWLQGVGSQADVAIPASWTPQQKAKGKSYYADNMTFAEKNSVHSTPTFFWIVNGPTGKVVHVAVGLTGLAAFLESAEHGKVVPPT